MPLPTALAPWLSPRTDVTHPVALAVGTMNFGKRTPEPEAVRVVRRAIERGLRYFDTANVYNGGESEKILGRALGKDRQDCFVATKVGLDGSPKKREGLSAKAIARAIDESLTRLGTDHVDVYYLHAPDPDVPILETVLAMKAVLEAGKALAWGVSNYASWQVLEIDALADAHGMPRPAVSQVMYNLLIRQLEIEYFAFARRYPLHTTVYNPLAGGLLAGKHREDTVPAGSRFDKNPLYLRRYWTTHLFELVRDLAAVAADEHREGSDWRLLARVVREAPQEWRQYFPWIAKPIGPCRGSLTRRCGGCSLGSMRGTSAMWRTNNRSSNARGICSLNKTAARRSKP